MKAIWIIALRGIRGARRDFFLFAWAIFLSVAMATGMAATAKALQDGLDRETRAMLAADLRIESATPFPEFLQAHVSRPGWQVAENLEFTAMVRVPGSGRTVLVEVLAASDAHPLRGSMALRSGLSLQEALREQGAVVESALFERLGLESGATFELGEARFRLADVLLREPDRVMRFFRWGPRVVIPRERAVATGLLGLGSRVQHVALVRLPEGENLGRIARHLGEVAAGTGLRVMTPADSQPAARRFVERFTLFLQLMTLLTLLTAGNAMAGAMAAHARENRAQIAILKSLGAGHMTVVGIFLVRLLLMAAPASLAGAAVGSGFPGLLSGWGEEGGEVVFSGAIFGIGAGAGMLLGVIFSLGALWSTRSVSPAGLFRAVEWGGGTDLLHWKWRWGVPVGMTLLAAFVLGGQGGWKNGAMFAVGLAGSLGVLLLVARGAILLLRRLRPSRLVWRLAVRGLAAHGSGTTGAILSVGLGVGALCAIFFLEQNFDRQMVERLPERVPGFFLIDLQPDQEPGLRQLAGRFMREPDGLRVTPVVRGRIQALKEHKVTPEWVKGHPQAWRFQRDYVLTWAESLPAGNRLTEGRWWGDSGAMEASVEREMARALNLRIGDTLAFDILGEVVSAPITSIREVRWSDMGLNFFVIFSPAVLAGAPYSYLASVMIEPGREEAFRAAVVGQYHNVSVIAAREVMERAREMLERLITSVRLAGGMAAAAGLTALAVSVTLIRRRRAREAAIRRLLGATQRDLALGALVEYLLLGGIATVAGVAVGQGITLGVMVMLFNDVWDWLPLATLLALVVGTATVTATGYAATRRDLDRPVMEALRRHA
ncbi:MAG: FtsX-like permease family protein [Magnetococcales bacterium]|nr:FtsX-like permease family protein [Magnetococcales bacterium]